MVRASGICLDGPGFNSQSGRLFCLTQHALYKDALTDGLGKMGKYYSHLDKKPSFVLMLSKTLISLVVRHINVNRTTASRQ